MSQLVHRCLGLVWSAAVALGCDGGGEDGGAPEDAAVAVDGGIDGGAAAPLVRDVPAGATWPGLGDPLGPHRVAVPPPGARLGRLLVFFPGTGAAPSRYGRFVERAAQRGLHAVSLSYVNVESINFDLCPGQPPSCHEATRLEILLGVESGRSPPDVDAEDAAYHRLARLLEHLDARHPDEGWAAFIDPAGEARWAHVAVAGHSQGGGHAAMTARLRVVERAILFDATEPVAWTAEPFATTAGSLFGFAHTEEPIFDPIVRSWSMIGIPGDLTSVDGASSPFGGSQRLTTSRTDCRGDPSDRGFFHNCPIVDDYLPLDDAGQPVFLPVWDHLLLAPPG